MNHLRKKRLLGALVVVGVVTLSLALVSIPTDVLMDRIGTDNAYIFMYVIALVGSITTFASIPYPLILIGLAAGGLNPILIGLTAACGVITSDSITFFAARKGRVLLGEKLQHAFIALHARLKRHPRLLTPFLILYGSLAPLSNDFAVISFSLMKYRFLQVIPALAVGNMIFGVVVAYLGVYGYDWITRLL